MMETLAKGFYFVWNPRGHAPTHCHSTFDLARNEAIRLARQNSGEEFIVLGAMCSVKKHDIDIITFDTTSLETPF